MLHDTIIQWLAALFVFGWLDFSVFLVSWWPAIARWYAHQRKCRALKEAREIVEQHWYADEEEGDDDSGDAGTRVTTLI